MSIILTGEQRDIITLPFRNPIQIKGVAGSGKTTVAIFRAKHLIATAQDLFNKPRVCIFSYNKSLIKYIQSIIGDAYQNSSNLTITTFHKWAYAFLKERGFWLSHKVANDGKNLPILDKILGRYRKQYPNLSIFKKSAEFFKDEIAWLKGRRIIDFQQYLDAKRTGRGTADRVTAKDKEYIWFYFMDYAKELDNNMFVDFDDYALRALDYIERESAFIPPYSHIVIDEAQDLTVTQLTCIKNLVSTETNSITIIADTAQRIYKSGFSWSGIGINVLGSRSVELKHNYRNTRQIAEAAVSLLAHDPQQNDFSKQILPTRDGPKPEILRLSVQEEEIFICEEVQKIDLTKYSVVAVHRTKSGVEQLMRTLWFWGFQSTEINSDDVKKLSQVGLFSSTMFSIKGLEFDHVFICDINDSLLPYPLELADGKDDLHICTERRLLYTCMTRARQSLHLIYTGKPSRFIAEIDPLTVDFVG